jgi:lauroyl/myristoyl acyltransferase
MEQDFNWQDSESVILKTTEGIAVYRNPSNDIVIRTHDTLRNDDMFVCIPEESMKPLIKALAQEIELDLKKI